MILSNIEIIYETLIVLFLVYLSYKILLGQIIFIDKYYIHILKFTPVFWIVTKYYSNILSGIIFILYIVFCVLVFAYTKKNVIIIAKKEKYLSFLYKYFVNKEIRFKYDRKVYEVSIYLPDYNLEIASNKTIISYLEIILPASITTEEQSVVNIIRKNSKNKNLNINRNNAFKILLFLAGLMVFFYYY